MTKKQITLEIVDDVQDTLYLPINVVKDDGSTINVEEPVRKRDERKKKPRVSSNKSEPYMETSYVPACADSGTASNNPILNSDVPYEVTFSPTINLLTDTIGRIDNLGNQLSEELCAVRNLRNSTRKYDYISSMAGTASNLLSSRIGAIKELNNVISKCHEFEFKRAKELKLGVGEKDDDKYIMDMYGAFLSAPMTPPPGSNIPYAMSQADIMNISTMASVGQKQEGSAEPVDPGYNEFMKNLSPEQNAMINENNPNIETILVYDQTTHEKHFEVIDRATGQQVHNMPLPADFILQGCIPDLVRGFARNADFNKNFPLKVVGTRNIDEV